MLHELIIFAIVFVTLQMVMALAVTCLLVKIFTSKKCLTRYVEKITEITEELY